MLRQQPRRSRLQMGSASAEETRPRPTGGIETKAESDESIQISGNSSSSSSLTRPPPMRPIAHKRVSDAAAAAASDAYTEDASTARRDECGMSNTARLSVVSESTRSKLATATATVVSDDQLAAADTGGGVTRPQGGSARQRMRPQSAIPTPPGSSHTLTDTRGFMTPVYRAPSSDGDSWSRPAVPSSSERASPLSTSPLGTPMVGAVVDATGAYPPLTATERTIVSECHESYRRKLTGTKRGVARQLALNVLLEQLDDTTSDEARRVRHFQSSLGLSAAELKQFTESRAMTLIEAKRFASYVKFMKAAAAEVEVDFERVADDVTWYKKAPQSQRSNPNSDSDIGARRYSAIARKRRPQSAASSRRRRHRPTAGQAGGASNRKRPASAAVYTSSPHHRYTLEKSSRANSSSENRRSSSSHNQQPRDRSAMVVKASPLPRPPHGGGNRAAARGRQLAGRERQKASLGVGSSGSSTGGISQPQRNSSRSKDDNNSRSSNINASSIAIEKSSAHSRAGSEGSCHELFIPAFCELGGNEDGTGTVAIVQVLKVLQRFELAVDLAPFHGVEVDSGLRGVMNLKEFSWVMKNGLRDGASPLQFDFVHSSERRPSSAGDRSLCSSVIELDTSAVRGASRHRQQQQQPRSLGGSMSSISSANGGSARGVGLEAEYPMLTLASPLAHLCRQIRRNVRHRRRRQLEQAEIQSALDGSVSRDPSLPPPAKTPLAQSAETTLLVEGDADLHSHSHSHDRQIASVKNKENHSTSRSATAEMAVVPHQRCRSDDVVVRVKRPSAAGSHSGVVVGGGGLTGSGYNPSPPSSAPPYRRASSATADRRRHAARMAALNTLSPYYTSAQQQERQAKLSIARARAVCRQRNRSPVAGAAPPRPGAPRTGSVARRKPNLHFDMYPRTAASSSSRRPSGGGGLPWDASTSFSRPEDPISGLSHHIQKVRQQRLLLCHPPQQSRSASISSSFRSATALRSAAQGGNVVGGHRKPSLSAPRRVRGGSASRRAEELQAILSHLYEQKSQLAEHLRAMSLPTDVKHHDWREMQRTQALLNATVEAIAAHLQELHIIGEVSKNASPADSSVQNNNNKPSSLSSSLPTAAADAVVAAPTQKQQHSSEIPRMAAAPPPQPVAATEELAWSCDGGTEGKPKEEEDATSSSSSVSVGDQEEKSLRTTSSSSEAMDTTSKRDTTKDGCAGTGPLSASPHSPSARGASTATTSSSAAAAGEEMHDGDGPSPLANALLDQLIKLEATQRAQRQREENGEDFDFTQAASASVDSAGGALGALARRSTRKSSPQLDFLNHSTLGSTHGGASLNNLIGIASILSAHNTHGAMSPEEDSHISPPLDCLLRSCDGTLRSQGSHHNRTMGSSDPFFARCTTVSTAMHPQQQRGGEQFDGI